jgi:hypothetical protein
LRARELIQSLEDQRRRLDEVQGLIAERGRLASAISLERAMMRLQMLADRLALLPADRVESEEVWRTIENAVQHADRSVNLLALAAAREERLTALADDLLNTLEAINQAISQLRDRAKGE